MHRLVLIDLTHADLEVFEAYEATVLPLVANHGGRLELRVRALDGLSETHLLYFPSEQAFEAYRTDPARVAAQDDWARCGAKSSVTLVAPVQP
jgi:hypothetical protein